MLSSAAVRSTAVPNVVTVLRKLRTSSPARIRSGTAIAVRRRAVGAAGQRGQLVVQRAKAGRR